MKFCTQCGSIWYLKKTGESELRYVCRNCGHSEEKSEEGICVHSSRMNEDYQNYQMLNNKHIIQDPTLPRLNNVKCINSQCLTNRPNLFLVRNSDILDRERLLSEMWGRISSKVSSGVPVEQHIEFRSLTSSEVTLYGEIHSCSEHLLINKEVELHDRLSILECKDPEVFQLIKQLTLDEPTLVQESILATNTTTLVPMLTEIQREVIFIKYDVVNMKYMYICTTCGSSWKNIA